MICGSRAMARNCGSILHLLHRLGCGRPIALRWQRRLEHSADPPRPLRARWIAAAALRVAAECRRDQHLVLPAACRDDLRAVGVSSAGGIPFRREDPEAHHPRPRAAARAQPARAIPRRDRRPRREARTAAAAAAALVCLRLAPRRPVSAAAARASRWVCCLRTAPRDVDAAGGGAPARTVSDRAGSRRPAACGRTRCAGRLDGDRVLPLARLAATVLLSLPDLRLSF